MLTCLTFGSSAPDVEIRDSSEGYLFHSSRLAAVEVPGRVSLAHSFGDTGSATIGAPAGMWASIHPRVTLRVSARESTRPECTLYTMPCASVTATASATSTARVPGGALPAAPAGSSPLERR